jgi:hypothetical protein
MGVGMVHLPVAVLMGVPEGAIGEESLQLLGRMIVLVMGIATALLSTWTMAVAMGMLHRFVAMPVAVLFAQQQPNPSAHQPCRQQQGTLRFHASEMALGSNQRPKRA